jgi:hypothetical protein
MTRRKGFRIIVFVWACVTALPSLLRAAPIDDLIAAAKKEGTVEFFAAGTLGPEARKN